MITISDLNCKEENYAWWLTIMPDEMPRLSILPKEVRERLDYSLASLDVIEKYILDNYTLDEMKDKKNKFARDLFARYIGETLRKNIPELYWSFESEDQQHDFYGVPVLQAISESKSPLVPDLSVLTLIEKREGHFLRSCIQESGKTSFLSKRN